MVQSRNDLQTYRLIELILTQLNWFFNLERRYLIIYSLGVQMLVRPLNLLLQGAEDKELSSRAKSKS